MPFERYLASQRDDARETTSCEGAYANRGTSSLTLARPATGTLIGSQPRWSACYTEVGTATSAATPKPLSCSPVARSAIRAEMSPVELPRLTTPARSEFQKRNSIGPSNERLELSLRARRARY
jgi:hypothetical protein